jgi:hypothetical protein
MRSFYFIIFITFLFPFVSAQLPDNDYSLDAFSGYFDILINFLVPFLIFVIVDYDYDDTSSTPIAQLARSIIYFVIIGLQQEIAYAFSPDNVSTTVKVLQHIIISLMLFGIIAEFILVMKTRGADNNQSSDNEEEERFESLKRQLRKQLQTFKRSLEKGINSQIENLKKTLEENFNIKIQALEDNINYKYQILVENINNHFQILVENIENRIQTLIESINKQLENLREELEKQIQALKEEFEKHIKKLKEKFEEQFQKQTKSLNELRSEYEGKVETLEERVKTLEEKMGITIYTSKTCRISNFEEKRGLPDSPQKLVISTNTLRSVKHIVEKGESLKMQKMTADLEEKGNPINRERGIPADSTSNSKSNTQKIINKINEFVDFNMIIRIGSFVDYLVLILFIISIGFLLNDLKASITRSFVLTIIITFCFTFFFQFMILIIAYSRKNLKRYIEEHQKAYSNIFPKYHAYITITFDIINTNMFYFPSLINYFLLQTPDIFNKIFLNLTALFVSSWIVLMYKTVLKNEGMKLEGEKEPEVNEEIEEGRESDQEKV